MNNLQENGLFTDKKSKKREKVKKRRNFGQIIYYLSLLADKISRSVQNSLFGYFLSDLYAKWNEAWKSSALYRSFKKRKVFGGASFKGNIAKLYEESLTCRIVTRISRSLIQSYLRIWGAGAFSFAFVTTFIAMLKYYFTSDLSSKNILIAIALALLSVPLIASKRRLGEALIRSRVSYYVIDHILRLDESKLEADPEARGGSYPIVLTVASALGLLTYLVDPLILIEIVSILILFVLIMCFPELGTITVLAVIPFLSVFDRPSMVTLVLVILSLLGFSSKFIRGKRVISFGLIDVLVLMFGALILFGGIFTRGGMASTLSAAMYFTFILIYFLIVNSYIRKTWIYRSVKLMVISTSIVALIGIFEDGVISSSLVDMSVFADIGARVSSLLGNPNMLGVYLVIVFPLCVGQMLSSQKKINKFIYALCSLSVLVCTIMTWSRGAWLGIMASIVLFALLYNFRTVWIFAAGIFTMPLWIELLPRSVFNRLLSIVTMSDSSVIYRFNTWRGVVDMIGDNLLSGVGVGESAFKHVYSMYAVPGTESVMHSHNLFLQITLELGIIGIVIFALILLTYSQKCFSDLKNGNRHSKSEILIAASFSGIVGALVMGLTDHIWYNYRVFLVFWAVLALSVALIKINDKERAKEIAANENESGRAVLDIYL
ncbi:MAG: O-antigen ligase family protein [Clostridia bacterium]|nr:O-antigen ligase family protein [Clostridia bacterium]